LRASGAIESNDEMTTSMRSLYRAADLRRLINPSVVAVVGASKTRGPFGERTLPRKILFSKCRLANPDSGRD